MHYYVAKIWYSNYYFGWYVWWKILYWSCILLPVVMEKYYLQSIKPLKLRVLTWYDNGFLVSGKDYEFVQIYSIRNHNMRVVYCWFFIPLTICKWWCLLKNISSSKQKDYKDVIFVLINNRSTSRASIHYWTVRKVGFALYLTTVALIKRSNRF